MRESISLKESNPQHLYSLNHLPATLYHLPLELKDIIIEYVVKNESECADNLPCLSQISNDFNMATGRIIFKVRTLRLFTAKLPLLT